MGLKFDTSEVADYADILIDAAKVAPADARGSVEKGALNIKTDARRRAAGNKHLPRLPYAITYDVHPTPGGASAEIGPDRSKKQGKLGNIPEYGTVNNPPRPYMRPAAEAELPRFERAMAELAEKRALGL